MKKIILFFLSLILFSSLSHGENIELSFETRLASTKNTEDLARLHAAKARRYRDVGETNLSIKSYLKSLKQKQTGWIWAELGAVYFRSGDYDNASMVATEILDNFPAQKSEGTTLLKRVKEEQYKINSKNFSQTVKTDSNSTRTIQQNQRRVALVQQTTYDMEVEQHFGKIVAAHPDFDNIMASGEIDMWVARQPKSKQKSLNRVLEQGTSQEVIDLLRAFKNSRSTPNFQVTDEFGDPYVDEELKTVTPTSMVDGARPEQEFPERTVVIYKSPSPTPKFGDTLVEDEPKKNFFDQFDELENNLSTIDFYKKYPFFLIVSFLLTWIIGLTPPLLLRFVFIKKQFSRKKSFFTVGTLWLINIIIFEALGSESKTHGALTLVALVSYAILRKGSAKNEEKRETRVVLQKRTKTAAISALKWAAGLTGGFIIGSALVILANGTGDIGGMIAEKLIVGIALFPIIFFSLWAWGTFSKKDPLLNNATRSSETNTNTLPSRWNYVSILAGIFMLLFVFLPDMINGTLAGQYYLGVLFWVIVIIYCVRNIWSKPRPQLYRD